MRAGLSLAAAALAVIGSAGAAGRLSQTASVTFAPYVERVPGTTVTFDMVPIAGGTFSLGSAADEPGRDPDEGPRHAVAIRPFWIGRFEVTWDEYDRFAFASQVEAPAASRVEPPARAGSASPPGADAVSRPTPPYGDESFGFGKGRQPAINITHHAAMEYTRWLSLVTGTVYRLPTEAEWEYAARAGSEEPYSFGRDIRRLDDHAWHAGNSKDRPQPVGLKKPNAWGLHDMHGNVAEWCIDRYEPDTYARFSVERPALSPVVLPDHHRYPHVVRGGSWADDPKELRSAARRASGDAWSRRDPQSPQSIWWHTDATIVGLRIARAVDEQPELRGLRSKITRNSP